MQIRSLSFTDFRNYRLFEIDGLGKLTVFVGDNAVGKTNVLEGIQLLTAATSFRHPQIAQFIREGADLARISCQVSDGNRELETALLLEPGKRRYTVNGKPKGRIDIRGNLPAVSFTPDDLDLAKGSSKVKRDALDDLGVQLARNYYIVRRDYEKTVRYKNRLLKDGASRPLIESIDETLVMCGSQLFCFRVALFERLVVHVSRIYAELSRDGEPFEARYMPSWEKLRLGDGSYWEAGSVNRDEVRRIMEENLLVHFEQEQKRCRSLVGPHNDQLEFLLDGRDVASFASQGQQRSVVLAWKLAEVELTRQIMGLNPVLLLDDVLSELDESRRETLVRFVTDEIQTFITATDLSGFSEDLAHRAQVVELPLIAQ